MSKLPHGNSQIYMYPWLYEDKIHSENIISKSLPLKGYNI